MECGAFTGPGGDGDTGSKVDVDLLRIKRLFGGLIVGRGGSFSTSGTSGSSSGPKPSS